MIHAKASPSGYKRWSNCLGSLTLEEKLGDLIPPDEGSEAARLGTELHSIAERALKGECEPCEETQFYVDYCRQAAAADEAEMIIEARVPLFYSREEHGYADCVIRTDTEVHVIDLKTGANRVDVKNCWQLLIYAYGMAMTSTQRFKMTIVQDNRAESWEIDMDQADALASVIGVKAQAAMNPYIHELKASEEACRWCPCKPYCKAYTKLLIDNMGDIDAGMERLSDEKMAYLFANKPRIVKTLSEIERVLFERVSAGESIKGVKMGVSRRGFKTWSKEVDPVSAMVAAGINPNDAIVSKPISPTQALKLSPDVEGWYQPDGRPTLKAGDAYDPAEDFDLLE